MATRVRWTGRFVEQPGLDGRKLRFKLLPAGEIDVVVSDTAMNIDIGFHEFERNEDLPVAMGLAAVREKVLGAWPAWAYTEDGSLSVNSMSLSQLQPITPEELAQAKTEEGLGIKPKDNF